MLTAKTEEIDKVLGLELGADDYITKPFSVREFRSRVKAVPRRAALTQTEEQFEEPIESGELRIDFEKRLVEVRGAAVRLTYVEFEILAALRAPGRVFSRTMLLERVWGDAAYRDPRTIDVHIRHLREKLESEPKIPELILTVRGVGYRFRDGERHQVARQQDCAHLLLITAAAFGVIYFWVVTQPESSLEERRLSDLEAVAGAYSGYVERACA